MEPCTARSESDRTSAPPTYVDNKQAAKYLATSVRTLDHARARGEIPYYRRSRRKIIFCIRDLDRWMARFRVDPLRASKAA